MKKSFRRESVGGPSGLDILVCEPLAERGVPHGFTLRSRRWNGEEVFGARDHGARDREELARALGLHQVAHMRQVHGTDVRVSEGPTGEPPVCDGLITRHKGVALVVQTADCVPLLLWDESTNAVAAVHAGWRGALAGVTGRAVFGLSERFGSSAASLHAALGPAIGGCCYEVGDEVTRAFEERFPYAEVLCSIGPHGKSHVDLIEANSRQLHDAGVPRAQIYSSGMCTSCDNQRLYSYRKEGKGIGRLMGAIGVS